MKKKLSIFILISILASGAFAQFNLEASKAAWIDGVTNTETNANEHGVFPVMLSWDTVPFAQSYSVFRGLDKENLEYIGLVTNTAYIDANKDAKPNEVYYYQVRTNVNYQDIVSEIEKGYGALTTQVYMLTYNQTIYINHPKMVLMNNKSNLAKLGKEEVAGKYSGTCFYQTKLKGLSGIVMMKYTNYCDTEGWIFNGYANVKANISANGMMFGTMIVSGMYPGTVCYDNIEIKKGNAGGGYYTIEPEGFDKAELPWDAVPEELIANETLDEQD